MRSPSYRQSFCMASSIYRLRPLFLQVACSSTKPGACAMHRLGTSVNFIATDAFNRLYEVLDKGKAASVTVIVHTLDERTGEVVFENQTTLVCRGSGGFSGKRTGRGQLVYVSWNRGNTETITVAKIVELRLRPTPHRIENLTPSSRKKHHFHKPRYTGVCHSLHVHRPHLKGVSSLSGDSNPLHVCETNYCSSHAADMKSIN